MKKNTYLDLAVGFSLPLVNDVLATSKTEKKVKTKHINSKIITNNIELVLLTSAFTIFLYWLVQGLKGMLQ